MSFSYKSHEKSVVEAKLEAQKIAFGPIMFQAAKALRDMGILEYLLRHKRSGSLLEDIARELDLSDYGVKVLLEAGLSLEMVYVENERWYVTKTGYQILRDELTRVNMDFTHDVNYQGFFHLQEAIKTGKPAGLKVFGEWKNVYEGLSEMPEDFRKSWFDFDHFYSDQAFPEVFPYLMERKPECILDVGGNTGKFSIFCTQNDPDIRMTIVDLPGQLRDARKNIEAAGMSQRIDTVPANLLDPDFPLPKGHNIIWMSQFLVCFSQEEVLSLLQRAKAALPEGGALYILDTYWDKQAYRASTYCLHATSLYFTVMANGNSQMYHSRDLTNLIEKAGMKISETIGDIGWSHTLFICEKA